MYKVLYLGSDPKNFLETMRRSSSEELYCQEYTFLPIDSKNIEVKHLQIIEIKPRPYSSAGWILSDWQEYTHLLFTSKHAVSIFADLLKQQNLDASSDQKSARSMELLPHQMAIAVGRSTGEEICRYGWRVGACSEVENQEGVVHLLRRMRWSDSTYLLWPRSALARGVLTHFLVESGLRHQIYDLYDTHSKSVTWPDLEEFDRIYFSSPSVVRAFFAQVQQVPRRPILCAIGPVTWQNLSSAIKMSGNSSKR
jgi:uroporphyrinogen-III synthase